MRIKNTHENLPGDDPEIEFGCQYSPDPNNPITDVTAPIGGGWTELVSVNDLNYYYVVEARMFEWDNVTSGSNFIVCKTIETDSVGSGDSLGVSNPIPFNSIVSNGRFFSTNLPADSDFYIRCKDCEGPLPAGTPATKQIGVYSLRLSDNLEYFPITSPDLFMECQNNGDPSVYTMELKDVKRGATDYIVNKRFTQWTWDPTESSQGATCGIYNRGGITRQTSGIGTNIIGYTNISESGTKYYWPGDPGTWVTFKDCSDPEDCNSAALVKVSLFLIAALFALL